MSQPYYIDDRTPARPPSQSSNTLGLVGFIVSLASLATCGFLSPIAFLISLAGLFRSPRGFAIAGASISALTTAALVGVFAAVYSAGRAVNDEFQSTMNSLETENRLRRAGDEIDDYRIEHGFYPTGVEGNKLILSHKDAWEHPLIYERDEDGNTYTIRSMGPDGVSGTEDDLTRSPSGEGDIRIHGDAADEAETSPEI